MENKVIFESEEQARKMFDDCIEVRNDPHCDVVNECVYNAKQAGYIRKTALEEADYVRDNYTRDEIYSDPRLIDIIIDGYDELKSEIARLKK